MQAKIFLGLQILGGLMLVIFGSNKFFHFMEMQPGTPEMGAYMMALFKTGFLFPLIAVVEILSGLAFISNKFAPLMAVVLIPVMLNALLAHLFLDPAGMGGALVILIITITVMYNNKARYSAILKP